MENFKFTINDKDYELNENNCNYLFNDEEKPVIGIDLTDILALLNQHKDINFNLEYYDQPCPNCKEGIKEKAKFFKFYEYHFFVFTKEEKFVISTISMDYENTSFNKLLKKGIVDNSYIASVMICVNCGDYSIEIEQCEV